MLFEIAILLLQVAATETETGSVSYCTVRINISDVNDNSPQFNQKSYKFSISEAAEEGDPVLPRGARILATDEDSGAYGNVTYSIQRDQNRSV